MAKKSDIQKAIDDLHEQREEAQRKVDSLMSAIGALVRAQSAKSQRKAKGKPRFVDPNFVEPQKVSA